MFVAAIMIYVVAGSANPAVIWAAFSPACQIKGNVSIATGERIYHMPGQRRFIETNISPRYGERWFCTAEDAERAGWRRAGG